MKVRRWVPHRDYQFVQEWADHHRLPCPTFKELPMKGYIVDGVAIGFMYIDNSATVGFMENFISNKYAKPRDVYNAIHDIITALSYEAQILDITTIRASTTVRGMVKVATKAGLKVVGTNGTLLMRGF